MREVKGQTLKLKHHPFPFREKHKKEYIIGEALLKWKGIAENEVATLKSVPDDPPDLVFETGDFGKIMVEITESVPYDRYSEAKSAYFLNRLNARLRELGTRPPKPSNIFVSRGSFDFPSISRRELDTIAGQIDRFFKRTDFESRYEIIQDVVTSKIRITFIPALGAWARPPKYYINNLFVHNMTGYPLDKNEFASSFRTIIKSKRYSQAAADILIIFQGTIGIVGLSEGLLVQIKNRLTSSLAYYQGIYIVEIIQFPSDYWVHVITVREHPLFKTRNHP